MLQIDDKDHKIISVLKEDARKSIRDIAKETNLRPSTVQVRISKLTNENIIEKFTLKLNNKAVGEDFIVFMLIQINKELPKDTFSSNHIKEVFGLTGEYDLMMKLKFSGIEEFNNFVLDFRKKHDLKKTLTMVATVVIKE